MIPEVEAFDGCTGIPLSGVTPKADVALGLLLHFASRPGCKFTLLFAMFLQTSRQFFVPSKESLYRIPHLNTRAALPGFH